MFHHTYRYAFIAGLALFTFLNTLLCEVYFYFRIQIEWYYALATIFTITFFIWEGNRLIEPYIRKRFSPAENKLRFLAVFFLTGNLVTVLTVLAVVFIVTNLVHGEFVSSNMNPLKLNIIYGGLANLLVHLLNAIHVFFTEYKRQREEAEELRRMNTEAEIQLIKNQVNPHFLFNNLNVLSGMVIRDNPEANQFIEKFSTVYRYILNNQQKELVELRTELEFIQPYLFLLQKRFENGIIINMDIPEECHRYFIVPAALQLLIENAIKHNIVSRSQPLQLVIKAVGNESILVRNNLQPRQQAEPSSKTGLKNIQKRYELISSKTVIIHKEENYFEVVLPLLNVN